jgi:methanogenic corrinoid protein MtbC1
MSDSGKLISSLIQEREEALAAGLVKRQWTVRPDLERRYGREAYRKCLEDAHFHLKYLAEAIAASEPKLFTDYIAWAKLMLSSRNVPAEDLCSHLQVLRDVVGEELPNEAAETARSYVAAAIESFPRSQNLPTFLDEGAPLTEMARTYLASLLRFERHVATKLILDAVDSGTSILDIYRHIFERCQREIGRLWQLNAATVAQEHYCTASTQLIMALLYPRMFAQPSGRAGSLIAACVPGELHELGPRMLCDILEMQGWDTIYLGANLPLASLVQTINARRPDIIAISATMTFHVDAVRRVIGGIRAAEGDRPTKIWVGGYAFRAAPEIWHTVGADAYATDAYEAARLLEGVRV